MAAGIGLTPEQRQLLLQALAQGGSTGMADPAAALQGLLAAPGGVSAAQAIIAGLRNKLLPGAQGAAPGPSLPSPATTAARGLSGAEPNYAQPESSGILGDNETKPAPKKTDDITDVAKKLAEKTPDRPTGNGILSGDIVVPPVPDVPEAGAAVRSAVGGSLRAAARRGQGAMPSERSGPIAITDTITKAALRHGVDPTGLIKTAGIESRFNPNAKNPNSSAGGLFQFLDKTAKSYGLTNKYDAAQASDAAARLWKDNKNYLTRSLGREPTNGELYLAHQQGPAGAVKIIKNPDASVSSTVGGAAAGLNAGKGLTNRQFVNMWTRRMGGGSGTPETAAQQGALLGEARQSETPTSDVPLPPRRPADLGGDSQPLTLNVTPSAPESTPAPDTSADFSDVSSSELTDAGDAGALDIGGLLGGLGGDEGGADSAPSQLDEWDQEDAQEEKQPEKPLIPEEDKKPAGILSGDSGSLIGNQDEKTDLARVFQPDRFGGSGLFGRDQAPETTGFKAPVGLPPAATPSASTAGGILGAPATGIASITPPQLRSIAQPSVPLPTPRPTDLGTLAPAPPPLAPPDVTPPAGPGWRLPRREGQPDEFKGGIPNLARPPTTTPAPAPALAPPDVPLPPQRPSGILGNPVSPPAVDPDRMLRDPVPGLAAPPTGPGMGGENPPWQDPVKPTAPGILGSPSTAAPAPAPEDFFDKLTRNAGILSGALGQAHDSMGSSRRPSGSTQSRPIVPPMPQEPLLTSGLLSNARAGIDLNRFFGLLSGRVG